MALVAIGWQVYDVRENPLDLALIGLAEFLPLLDLKTPIVPAVHRNNAGIIGAAALALS